MALYFHTPAEMPTGYGYAYSNLCEQLKLMGVELTEEPEWDDVQVSLTQPFSGKQYVPHFTRWCHKQFIFTMFETSFMPEGWSDNINKSDGLIVPSTWCCGGFAGQGIEVPVYVVPLGIDPERWKPMDRPADRDIFTFLWQGVHYLDRKGGELVRSTFLKLRAGGAIPNGKLILKWTRMWSLPFRSYGFNSRHILDIGDYISEPELDELIWRADCSVNPTGGEGFGLIPLEHMATGLPAIITAATGQLDYMRVNGDGTSDVCYPLRSTLNKDRAKSALLGPNVVPEVFPDADHLAELMEHCYANREEVRATGERASRHARTNWTWARSAQAFLTAIAPQVEVGAVSHRDDRAVSI